MADRLFAIGRMLLCHALSMIINAMIFQATGVNTMPLWVASLGLSGGYLVSSVFLRLVYLLRPISA